MHRVRNEKFLSHQMLDRIELALASSEQLAEYTEMLVQKVDEYWFPSHQMLDRIQGMMERTAIGRWEQ